MDDNIQLKTTFGGRPPSVDDYFWWKTTFGGRQPSWKTTFGGTVYMCCHFNLASDWLKGGNSHGLNDFDSKLTCNLIRVVFRNNIFSLQHVFWGIFEFAIHLHRVMSIISCAATQYVLLCVCLCVCVVCPRFLI